VSSREAAPPPASATTHAGGTLPGGAIADPDAAERARVRAKILAWFRALLVFVGLLPWALPVARARLPLGEVGAALDLAFFAMCHRRPARTLFFEGVPMPLCSRCAGIFLGVALAAIIGRPLLSIRTWRWLFVGACGLMLADVVTQDLGLHPVWHPTRIATGLLVGYGMVIGLLSGISREPA
jgi:uncharacterized membrane protein